VVSSSTRPVEWISFTDDENTTWLFDLTFLTSGWSCTFGTTCKGTEPQDNGARGCCAHGAHLIDGDERLTITDAANRLTPDDWQNAGEVDEPDDLFMLVDGAEVTRTVDDACIFLNGRGFPGGHGCALHIGALAAGERPMDWKPAVCWQVPFRLEEYEDGSGTRTVAVRAWRRSDWGEGGDDFGWWCTDDLPPGDAASATWLHHQDELIELVGLEPVAKLNEYLSARGADGTAVSLSPRPNKKEKKNKKKKTKS
jgi:hypothetical protein